MNAVKALVIIALAIWTIAGAYHLGLWIWARHVPFAAKAQVGKSASQFMNLLSIIGGIALLGLLIYCALGLALGWH